MKNNEIIIKGIDVGTLLSIIASLIKLFEQDEYWFMERMAAVQVGDWGKAYEIERTYIQPIGAKIRILAERGSRL